jgi:flagellar basal-body rod modification protein FlgD
MTVSSATNSALDNISSQYVSSTSEESNETLGREEFLTLLVAQLENQDPLNPQEGTDFTAQLAEYSQLEQLMNLNETIETLSTSMEDDSSGDATQYIGKEVTGYIDSMDVSDGSVTAGFYNLNAAADIIVDIYDANGNKVDRMYEGQKSSGGQLIAWDGNDANGDAVADGQYTYVVMADYGEGYEQVTTSVTGTVDGVTYNNGTPYLVVQGVLVSIDDLTSVTDIDSDSEINSIMDYLGQSVETTAPIVLVENGDVSGEDLSFEMDSEEAVIVRVYDAYDELVNEIGIDAEDIQEGTNTVHWNGVDSNGTAVNDGLYYYTVQTASGDHARTDISGEISSIRKVNDTQYLEFKDSGRLVSLSNINKIY